MLSKEEKFSQKRRVITNALKQCLARDVYSRITIQDIADVAGFSKGGVLHYFSTKEDIYLALINDIFAEFEKAHVDILNRDLQSREMAPFTALLSAESFILDKTNIRILINIILYSLEEESIKKPVVEFISKHYDFYKNLLTKARVHTPTNRKSDLDPTHLARIAQAIVMFIGILEVLDPCGIDYVEIVKYVSSILKG